MPSPNSGDASARAPVHAGAMRTHRSRPPDAEYEVDTGALSDVFATPGWLRDLGLTSWLLVGVTGMIVAAVWLLGQTNTIVTPVVTAAIVAAVLSPLVRWLHQRGIPRGVGAALVFVGVLAVG